VGWPDPDAGGAEMIDMKISIAFSIINLTDFEWHELQESAQRIARNYVFHTVPQSFLVAQKCHVTYNDVDLIVFVRRLGDALEFLFVQPSLLQPEEPRGRG